MKKSMMGFVLMAMMAVGVTTACGHGKTETTDAVGTDSVDSVSDVTAVDTITTEKAEYHKASGYGTVDISLELPNGSDAASVAIRNSLWNKLLQTMGQDCGYNSAEDELPRYRGVKNLAKLCHHYGSVTFSHWNAAMKKETDERNDYIINDDERSEEDKKSAIVDTAKYAFDIKMYKLRETPTYVVFTQTVYGYAGGVHGGVYGWGDVTFNRKSGKELKAIIKTGMVTAMQPLLKRGLKQYFCNEAGAKSMTDAELYDNLQIEGRVIPLPQGYNVCPNEYGIVFTYGQYEIACYAAGMPSFTVPYSQIKPYLTDEAKEVLLLNNN